ncbi:ATP-binding protein [Labedella populi]|uniref:ATP-binding protein n=1 Tax=Labedella populi TaxID=2498850 RepID=A0A3S4A2M9_9MICO|nr:AAA family ATPase [Labedella populi]RWZ68410.1 ATP-binding protein [Labedella populi]
MISTLAVAGYRSVRDLVIALGGLDIVTGPNGSGKSSLYRALRLLASTAGAGVTDGGSTGTGVVGALAREGGLASTLWAGPEGFSRDMLSGDVPVQGGRRSSPVSMRLGFGGDDLGYLVDLGIPRPGITAFVNDPEIKREQIFAGGVARPSAVLVDRSGPAVRVRDAHWRSLERRLDARESILSEFGGDDATPEIDAVRRSIRRWRFYDHLRTDADAPSRRPRVGTATPVLSSSGADLAACLQTIREQGGGDAVDAVVDRAFPGTSVRVEADDGGLFRVRLRQPGMLRPLEAHEFSDGTLRFLLLTAALLSTRPPELLVLNEPETSLHVDLLPALGELIVAAAAETQLVVVTHARALVDAVRTGADATEHRLEKRLGETLVAGQGMLDAPAWVWPTR